MKNPSKIFKKSKKRKTGPSTKRVILTVIGAIIFLWAVFGVTYFVDRKQFTVSRVVYKEVRTYDDSDWPATTPYKADSENRETMKRVQKLLDGNGIAPNDRICVNDFSRQTREIGGTTRRVEYEVVIHYRDGTVQDMSCEYRLGEASAGQIREAREFREQLWYTLWQESYLYW